MTKKMINNLMQTRYISIRKLLCYIILGYWLPIIILCLSLSSQLQWWLIINTLCISSIVSIVYLMLFIRWEKNVVDTITSTLKTVPLPLQNEENIKVVINQDLVDKLQTSIIQMETKKDELDQELNINKQALRVIQQENLDLKNESESLSKQMLQLKATLGDMQRHYDLLLSEKEKALHDHHHLLVDKQKKLELLECKIQDLNYEIKTILKITPK